MKTIEEINQKIKNGDAVVVTADEMTTIVTENGITKAAEEIDVVTTGTFGAMCSSGAFLNFGHSDPPIKMSKTILNGVEAYSGLAAVDAYIGAGQINQDPEKRFEYGGAHVIEDLICGKDIELTADAYGTDCYPNKHVETTINIETINEAIMVNPRNSYQNYAAAINCSEDIIYTYMGTLLSDGRNITYSSAGTLSPLLNDPYFETIGIGTKIFLCGGEGYIMSAGTQHSTESERFNGIPKDSAGTLMVQGDMKQMDSKYVKGVIMHNYGPTIFNGIGVPIPILNEDIAKRTAVSDEDIVCKIYDYGVSRRNKPVLSETNYKELRSGKIEINGKEILTSSLSSYKKAKEIAIELKNRIENKEFLLTKPIKLLPNKGYSPKTLNTKPVTLARDFVNKDIIKINDNTKLSIVAKKLLNHEINHLPVVNDKNKLMGIVTSWDIAKAVAKDEKDLCNVMTRKVISVKESDTIEDVVRLLDVNHISGVPIINDKNEVTGMITAEDITRLRFKES